VKFAAFLRNVNLGRPGAPTRAQLEQAFVDAGAADAQSFQVNGTAVFSARSQAGAERVLRKALKLLAAECDLVEPGCVRSLDELVPLVSAPEFEGYNPDEVYEFCFSFACARNVAFSHAVPFDNPKGDVRLLKIADGNVLSVSRKLGAAPGSPNLFLERLTSAPWTTRAIGTVRRLLAKHATAS
jgi:uncharacterized protein (DUF1697 family)